MKRLEDDGQFGPVTYELPGLPSIALVIVESSQRCNLACSYCFENIPSGGPGMTIATADRIVDSMQTLNLNDRILVEFNGGETFLNFPVFRHLVERIRNTDFATGARDISFTVQSNGTIMRPEIAKFLREMRINVGISLDGPPAIHDRNRKYSNGRGSAERIFETLEMLRTFGVDFGLLSVVERPEDVRPVYDFLAQQEPCSIRMNLKRFNGRSREQISPEDLRAIAKEHYKVFRMSLDAHLSGKRIPKLGNICQMIENILAYIPPYMCMRTPCGAGIDQIVYDQAGDAWPCQEFRGDERFRITQGPVLNLGLALSTNHTVAALRDRRIDDLDLCRDCSWLHFCEGGCFATTYVADGRDFESALRKKTPHCEYYVYMFGRLLWDVYYRRESVLSYSFSGDRGFIEYASDRAYE